MSGEVGFLFGNDRRIVSIQMRLLKAASLFVILIPIKTGEKSNRNGSVLLERTGCFVVKPSLMFMVPVW
jgi:hypothetical protein